MLSRSPFSALPFRFRIATSCRPVLPPVAVPGTTRRALLPYRPRPDLLSIHCPLDPIYAFYSRSATFPGAVSDITTAGYRHRPPTIVDVRRGDALFVNLATLSPADSRYLLGCGSQLGRLLTLWLALPTLHAADYANLPDVCCHLSLPPPVAGLLLFCHRLPTGCHCCVWVE